MIMIIRFIQRVIKLMTLFIDNLEKSNVKVMYDTKVEDLIVEDNIIRGIVTSNGNKILGDKVIISTGGKSVPATGSDGSMYAILSK